MKYFGGIPKELYNKRQEISAKKVSVIEIASNVLGCGRVRFEQDRNLLYIRGKWVPATINDIMREVNRTLAAQAKPQILNNPEWVVRYGE